jgi:hypothetical protein
MVPPHARLVGRGRTWRNLRLSDKNRPHRPQRLTVRFSADELTKVDRLRAGLTRGAFLRSLLRDASGQLASSVPSHAEAVALLAEQARQGIAASAVAYERALRPAHPDPVQARIDELAARRRAREAA